MVSSVISNISNNIKQNKGISNRYLMEGDGDYASKNNQLFQNEFNRERCSTKEQLQEKLNFLTLESFSEIENMYTEKENKLINENYYLINAKNASNLNDNISKIEYVNAKVNQDTLSGSDSLHDFFSEVKNSIVAGKNDYLDVLKDIFSNYMNYVNDLRDALSKLSQYAKAGSKEGYISVDFGALYDELNMVRQKYKDSSQFNKYFFKIDMSFIKEDDGRYYRLINGEPIYYGNNNQVDDAVSSVEKILNEIKGLNVEKKNNSSPPNIDFSLCVSIDFTDIDKFLDDLNNRIKETGDILQTEFDLFKKALDALEKKINTNLEELSKKYSAANSNFDNFVKIVSSTMNTLLEMAKGFLRF